ncbi:MAG TPA: serine/threonine-protein kinase, partial [Longimicrobiales bacterium]
MRFARERTTGSVVALSLTPRTSPPGAGESFDLTATRLAAVPPLQPPAPPPASSPTPTPGAPGGAAPVEQSAAADGGMVCPSCSTEYPPGARFCLRDGLALQPRVQRSDLIGQIIAGRYQLLRNLGEGGMGRVFLAEQIKMGRKCAVKILHKELAGNPESLARFSREAREVGRLDHPNIVQIHDFGEDDSGITYLAMEYVDGVTLTRILHEAGGPLPVARALAIGSQVAEALVAAHAAGLVHRDIKPDNVLVTRRRDGSDLVKVVDFGIAKAMYNDGFDTLTRTGYAVGTSRYMSPEQLIADPVDGRSDVYSCGCVLWEMLIGHPLWQGGAQEYARRLQQPAPRVRAEMPQLAPELDELVAHALEPRPQDRLPAALELRDGLEQLLTGLSEASRGAYRQSSPATGEPRVVSRLDATPVPARRTGREAVPGPAAPAPAAAGGSSGRVPLASTTPPSHPAAVAASSGEQETLGQVPPSAHTLSPATAGAAAGSIVPGATRISGRRVLAGALGVAGLALVIAFVVPWR